MRAGICVGTAMGLNHLEAGFGHREGTIVTTFTDTSTPRLLGSRRPVDVFGSAWPPQGLHFVNPFYVWTWYVSLC